MMINKIDETKKIVLLLDSLDQLTPDDYKNIDKWQIINLPPFVKLVVSTIPEHGDLLNMFKQIIKKKHLHLQKHLHELALSSEAVEQRLNERISSQFLYVKELDIQQSETILSNWLDKANRTLTESQWNDLRHIFKNGKLLPLFLKLIYDIVLKWRSFDETNPEFLKFTKIDQIIIYLFKSLERLHGSVVFKRAICYMIACKNGISDTELEDILSLGINSH